MSEHDARIGCQIELLHVTDLVSHSPVLGQVIPPRPCRRLNKSGLQRTRITDAFDTIWAGERAIVDRNGVSRAPDRCQVCESMSVDRDGLSVRLPESVGQDL